MDSQQLECPDEPGDEPASSAYIYWWAIIYGLTMMSRRASYPSLSSAYIYRWAIIYGLTMISR